MFFVIYTRYQNDSYSKGPYKSLARALAAMKKLMKTYASYHDYKWRIAKVVAEVTATVKLEVKEK